MILIRDTIGEVGAFGTLRLDDDKEICKTLERTYRNDKGGFYTKLPPGKWKCVRGVHRLANRQPFVTFEVTGIPGHFGILFHVGNWNTDSSGCILVGEAVVKDRFLIRSRLAFASLMNILNGIDVFALHVIGG